MCPNEPLRILSWIILPKHNYEEMIDIGNAATDMTICMEHGVPQDNGTTAVEPRMDVAHVARAVVYMAGLPLDVNVQFLTIMATKMPFIGRG
jgi:NADP-dependent 3-hydroxy acid dehydrogenase YdfG